MKTMSDNTGNFDPTVIANVQFQTGHFVEAEKTFLKIIKDKPDDYQALVLLGNLAMLSNRFKEAEEWLRKAMKVEPKEPAPHALLAEVFYRQDKFQDAAKHLRFYGIDDMAERLESFKDTKPYQIADKKNIFKVKMEQVDPLPIVKVKINDHEEVNFLVDTGAAELIIDMDFAKDIGLEKFGEKTGTFAGGVQASMYLSKIETFSMGDLKVENIPVKILPVRPISKIFGGKQIDGIIGTVLFYHFITTMDYTTGEVIFRKQTKENLSTFEKEIEKEKPIEIPFWMAEDHFMVAWGRVNKGERTLFFLDTGLAGGGFTGARKTLDDAGVKLDEENAFEGIGGGGKVVAIPFVVEELAFGDAIEKNINGVFTERFPIEYSVGFRIGGIISHQFFRTYSLTFDFIKMRFILIKKIADIQKE